MRSLVVFILAHLVLSPPLLAQDPPIKFRLPIKCELDKTCWLSRYMNLGTPTNPKDYTGGRLTDSDHNGIDFALQDLKQQQQGVEVLAVADGTVMGIRDDRPDEAVNAITRIKVKGIECGNCVMLDHGHGLRTHYCHMKRQSIRVKVNDKVKAGQTLGLVGLSGLSEYPHLHLTTFYNDKKIDPFMGIPSPQNQDHAAKPRPLWDDATMALMPYKGGKIYNIAITQDIPDMAKMREGHYRPTPPFTNPTRLIGATELFALNKGDKVTLTILDVNKAEVFKKTLVIPDYQARSFIYAGMKKPNDGWKAGSWQLRIDYESVDGKEKHARIEPFTLQ